MARCVLRILTIGFIAVIGVLAPAVLADGDPASDVLLIRDVFYLYNPPPSRALQETLKAEVAASRRAGFPIKVALIRAQLDLGLDPELFGKPQQYARFLGLEISLQFKGPLLVVMPDGYGVHGVSRAATEAIDQLPKPPSGQIDDLARAAIKGVSAVAAASGHPIATPASGGGSPAARSRGRTNGISVPLIAGLAAVVVIAAALLLLILKRRGARRRPR